MKEYNRKTKSWEEPTDTATSLKKRETCRGKRPHEYQLVLPWYVRTAHDFTSDEVLAYYALEDKYAAQKEEYFKEQTRLGCFGGRPTISPICRYFECKVCGKKEEEFIEVKK